MQRLPSDAAPEIEHGRRQRQVATQQLYSIACALDRVDPTGKKADRDSLPPAPTKLSLGLGERFEVSAPSGLRMKIRTARRDRMINGASTLCVCSYTCPCR